MIPPVVDQSWLEAHPEAVVADVRSYLDGRSGAEAYRKGHIPGAVFIALDVVLAEPASRELGRHPLPTPARFAAGLGAAGIGDDTAVVAYDDAGGAMAGRLVWLLRLIGRDAALLDGGIQAWDGELTTDVPHPDIAASTPVAWPEDGLADLAEAVSSDFLIDARATERYRGDVEPIDARAGHIPGARSYPFSGNLTGDLRFRTPAQLRERFSDVRDAAEVISSCGSGITACHNLIAMEYAGLGRGRLFPGSWSQYSATDLPAATGGA